MFTSSFGGLNKNKKLNIFLDKSPILLFCCEILGKLCAQKLQLDLKHKYSRCKVVNNMSIIPNSVEGTSNKVTSVYRP
jgi:hypothetical protein